MADLRKKDELRVRTARARCVQRQNELLSAATRRAAGDITQDELDGFAVRFCAAKQALDEVMLAARFCWFPRLRRSR